MLIFDVFIGILLGVAFCISPSIGLALFLMLIVFRPNVHIIRGDRVTAMQQPLMLKMMESKNKVEHYSKEIIGKLGAENIHDHLFVKDSSGEHVRYNFKSQIYYDQKGRIPRWPSENELFLPSGLIYEKEVLKTEEEKK